MTFILSIHPVLQLTAILLAFYAAYLGLQRTRSLHFGQQVKFQRERHVIVGSISLISLLGGLAGGLIIASRFLEELQAPGMHQKVAFTLLPFIVIGIFTGFFLYLNPKNRKVLPAVHAINNAVILTLVLVQIYTGWQIYLKHVL